MSRTLLNIATCNPKSVVLTSRPRLTHYYNKAHILADLQGKIGSPVLPLVICLLKYGIIIIIYSVLKNEEIFIYPIR